MRRTATEFGASAIVSWTVCATQPAGALATGVAVGAVLAVMMISGAAHANPLITAAIWARGAITGRSLLCRVAAQLSGGVVAGLAAQALLAPPPVRPAVVVPGHALMAALCCELVVAFLWAGAVVAHVPQRSSTERVGAGATAGLVVLTGTVAGGSVAAGGSGIFNPSAGVAMVMWGATAAWYVVACGAVHLLAATAAALVARPVAAGIVTATPAAALSWRSGQVSSADHVPRPAGPPRGDTVPAAGSDTHAGAGVTA